MPRRCCHNAPHGNEIPCSRPISSPRDYTVTIILTIPARTHKEATYRAQMARTALLHRSAVTHAAMPHVAEALPVLPPRPALGSDGGAT